MFGSASVDLSGYLTDVQIYGTSIVENGVANIPMANDTHLGAVTVNGAYGIGRFGTNGALYINYPTSAYIKSGTNNYRPIVSALQHESTFYGLAKIAGHDEKNSELPVGQYTDNAKDKIQTMLGVSPLIASHESDPFESAHTIGELFIANGKLYRAKTALAIGEYINEGTNVEVVNVAEVLDSKVKDVQVNGTSIISDGVANIPYAAYNKIGVVQVNASRGTAMSGSTISTFPVDSATAKAGVQAYQPITPAHQHESVFYGLAKAAGDTTQASSDNAVGTYTDNAKTSIQTMLGLNGVIKNTDYATSSTAGVVKVDSDWGIGMYDPAWSDGNYGNFLYLSPASSAQIKAGSTSYKAVVPNTQHEAIFYGLAKAAGDTTQSSSNNAVGIYTESAKSSISEMLNNSITVDGTAPTIIAKAGIRYVCGEVLTLNITVPSTGIIDVIFTSGSSPTVLTITPPTGMTMKWANNFDPAILEANATYEINIMDGYLGVVGKWT